MKTSFAALALLVGISGFCLWNSRTMAAQALRWQEELQQVSTLSRQQDWTAARALLDRSHRDWESRQPYLRTVSTHAVLEEAEELYRKAGAYADTENQALLLAALSHLDDQLQLISDREQLRLTNIF